MTKNTKCVNIYKTYMIPMWSKKENVKNRRIKLLKVQL